MSSPTKFTRRETLAGIAALALAGPLEMVEAQHVHQATAADAKAAGGVYKPKALTRHEFDSLRVLCELIVPGASKGGAAEFIDLLSSQNPEMAAIYTGGLAWLDEAMKRTYNADFLTARVEDRTAMLDKLAYRKNETPELAAGVRILRLGSADDGGRVLHQRGGNQGTRIHGKQRDDRVQGSPGCDRLRGKA